MSSGRFFYVSIFGIIEHSTQKSTQKPLTTLFWALPTLTVFILSQLSVKQASPELEKVITAMTVILASGDLMSVALVPCDKTLVISLIYKILIGAVNVVSIIRVRPTRLANQIDIILTGLICISSMYWYTDGIFYFYDLIFWI